MDPKGLWDVEDDDDEEEEEHRRVLTETVVVERQVEVERRTQLAREASDGESVESGVPVVRAKLG